MNIVLVKDMFVGHTDLQQRGQVLGEYTPMSTVHLKCLSYERHMMIGCDPERSNNPCIVRILHCNTRQN